MGVSYLGGWPDDGEQDGQQHQPVEQPQQRQDGEHRKEVPGGVGRGLSEQYPNPKTLHTPKHCTPQPQNTAHPNPVFPIPMSSPPAPCPHHHQLERGGCHAPQPPLPQLFWGGSKRPSPHPTGHLELTS